MIKYNFENIDCCIICGNPFIDKHHLIPKEMYGLDIPENIINLCPNHHRMFHFLIDFERMSENGTLDKINKKESEKKFEIFKYILTKENEFYTFYKEYATPFIVNYYLTLLKENKNDKEEILSAIN